MGFWTQDLGHRIQGDASQVDLLCKELSSFAKKKELPNLFPGCVCRHFGREFGASG